MFARVAERFREHLPDVDFCSLRVVRECTEMLSVQRGIVQPPSTSEDFGAMVTVIHRGGLGYAATSDLSDAGLRAALERAAAWAAASARAGVFDFSSVEMPHPVGTYKTAVEESYAALPIAERIGLLTAQSERLGIDPRIVHWTSRSCPSPPSRCT